MAHELPRTAERHLAGIAPLLAERIRSAPHDVALSEEHTAFYHLLLGQHDWSHGDVEINFSQPYGAEQPDPKFRWMDPIVDRLDAVLREHNFAFHHAKPFGRGATVGKSRRRAPGDVDYWYLHPGTNTAIVLRVRRKDLPSPGLPFLGIGFRHTPDNLAAFSAQRRRMEFPQNVHPVPEAAKRLVRELLSL